MKKWIGLIALITAANSVSATSLYEPFNYTANQGSALNGSVDTSEVPSQKWVINPSGTNDPKIGTLPSPLSTSGFGLADGQGTYAQLNKLGGPTADRIDLNASYAPGETIYYSMFVEVPTTAAAPAAGQGSFLAGFQWLSVENTTSSSYNLTTTAGALAIDYAGVNDKSGNPEYELGVGYRDTATTGAPAARVFDTTPLVEGQTYFVVVAYYDGPANNDDSASLYIDPTSSTFGQSGPGSSTPVATSTNPGTGLDYGTLNGTAPGAAWTSTSYLGNLVSFQLRNNASEAGNINLDDVRVDTSWAGVTAVEWDAAGSGSSDWGSAINWTSDVVPSATGADVTFGTNSTINNVTISSPQTVGTIRFNGTNSYTISGSATLTLSENISGTNPVTGATSTGPASIQVTAGSHTISAPVMLASSTNLAPATGASITLSGPVTAASGIALSVTGGGTASVLPASATALQGLSGLSITGGSKLTLSAAKSTITTTAFSIDSTSTLDLTNNDLIVDYAPNAANPTGTDTTTGPAVVAAVEAAYDAGNWDKPGITTSSAPLGAGRTLAVVDNGQLNTPLTTVDGVTLDTSSVVVKYTWYGDLNLDGVVNATDASMMFDGETGWAGGDLNYDGQFNADDWSLFFLGSAESGGLNISTAPEPGAVVLLAGLGLLGVRSRRRRA